MKPGGKLGRCSEGIREEAGSRSVALQPTDGTGGGRGSTCSSHGPTEVLLLYFRRKRWSPTTCRGATEPAKAGGIRRHLRSARRCHDGRNRKIPLRLVCSDHLRSSSSRLHPWKPDLYEPRIPPMNRECIGGRQQMRHSFVIRDHDSILIMPEVSAHLTDPFLWRSCTRRGMVLYILDYNWVLDRYS
ncbi:uncharacterized protein LOC120110431 [Phoenix dactylifera]|uniref:Uncharacterized protein LOC120110431 n=1 Tax=Phoenix dactylifera TaxID=42345 RepID=A0A8B9A3T7_PHODC|nr:uncharacterized protein LOC120110431 [Phoenix dactylifera]